MDGAYFRRRGDASEATELTRGPWNPAHQHGGPPAALLGRAIAARAGEDAFVCRLHVDLLRPVPIATLRVEVETRREGRAVRRYRATLLDAERTPLAVATGLALARFPVTLTALPGSGAPFPTPDESAPFALPFFGEEIAYHTSVEIRRAAGVWGEGDFTAWMRVRCAVVEGEAPTPLERVLVVADAGSGIGARFDADGHTFINADLDVALSRPLAGEWVGMHARTDANADGTGLADTELSDPRGRFGRGTQVLVVRPR